MQIIGLRKSDSINKDRVLISAILTKIKDDYTNFEWETKKHNEIEFFQIQILDLTLKIYFDNSKFIQFSGYGPFINWFQFADKNQSKLTDKIRKLFKTIASEYGISELLYFSEWFFELNEIRNEMETFEDLMKRIEDYPDLEKKELFGLEANEYYRESINTADQNIKSE